MDNLKQILLKKARIIGQSKYPQRKSLLSTLKLLKSIRKQEKQSLPEENLIIQGIIQHKITQKPDIQKMYFMSFTVMKSFFKKFQFIPQQKDVYVNIVWMHYNFYNKQQHYQKADEIKKIYRKKVMRKETLLSTLLYWLYDWGRIKLQAFLKTSIQSIEKDLLNQKLQVTSSKKQIPTSKKQQSQYQNNEYIESNLILDGTLKHMSNSTRVTRLKPKKSKHNENYIIQQIQSQQKSEIISNQIEQQTNCQVSTSMNFMSSPQIILKKQSTQTKYSFIKSPQRIIYNITRGQDKNVAINVNKQMFYGGYWKQIHQYYKNLSCIQGLDNYYLKTYKKQKQQKKQQIINKLDDVIQSIIKSMPHIKRSIQAFQESFKNHQQQVKLTNAIICEQIKPLNENYWERLISSFKVNTQFKVRQNIKSQNDLFQKKISEQSEQSETDLRKIKEKIAQRINTRNKSTNENYLRRIAAKRQQKQIRLPIVYNPESCQLQRDQNSDQLFIRQLNQKFSLSHGKPNNKGLVRYKFINTQKQKSKDLTPTPFESYEKLNEHSSKVSDGKDNCQQVANIRKILRKRQKQKCLQTYASNNQQALNSSQYTRNDYMLQQSKQSSRSQYLSTKNDKFLIFLKNIDLGASPFDLKKSQRMNSTNKKSIFQRETYSCLDLKKDSLPKLPVH